MSFHSSCGRRCARALTTAAVAFVLLGFGTQAVAAEADSTMDSGAMPGMNPAQVSTGNEHGDQNPADQDTPYGPLSQIDRNLIINVRWANLWEGPTSGQVATRSPNAKVRAVAAQLSREHHELDAVTDETAARLNVPLPGSPTPLQQAWMKEILSKTGADADNAFANLTREAHGTIFMLISQVRAQTRNDVMRAFAQSANEIVMRHMTLLESTGLVRSTSLVVGSTDSAPYQVFPTWSRVLLGIVVGCFALIGTVAVVRVCARYTPRTVAE
ncbi:DUF4142 domain-containing protein [Amycolatopsis pigmentata]|uniref:DUF4142 domain-containing protein n=1 Tax=Amycolatopsis pigmentata TaxID=450801 RepID=A0ABW5G051_9PSEU